MTSKRLSNRDIVSLIEDADVDELAEIPSDNDSIVDDDGSSEDISENEDNEKRTTVKFREIDIVYDSDTDVDSNSDESSDDDIPLAQLCLGKIAQFPTVPSVANVQPAVTPKWNQNYITNNFPDFSLDSGVGDNIKNLPNPTPINIFKEIVTENIINHIVFQTNLYAEQLGKRFVPTYTTEIEAFLGINFLMGIKPQASYRDYWSSNPLLNDAFVSQLMTVNRFGWLLSHIHLNDNVLQPERGTPEFDKLYKVRPVLDMLSERFKECLKPGKMFAVDESMIKFKGRSSLKQYMPKKPIKRGYKVWMLCEKSGYVYKFSVYTGKVGDSVQKNLGESVVLNLCTEIEGSYHHLYFDNYFSTYSLLVELKIKKILACGTVQANRKHLPSLKEDRNLKRGEYDWRVSDTGVSFMKWKDKKSVHLISNFHNPADVTEVTRTCKDGSKEVVPCPVALKEYNEHMNSVDKLDQLKKYYEIDRKSRKWWHRIFFHFMDVSVVNAYILKSKLGPCQPLKKFKLNIIEALTSQRLLELPLGNRRGRPSTSTPIQIKKHKPHVPAEIRLQKAAHQPCRSTLRRCAKCSVSGHQRRTKWLCDTCKVPLCLGPNKTCFSEYHKQY